MDLHLDILPARQQEILPFLADLKSDWYLAGGTALALQFGHRESVDFDFFRGDSFDTEKLFKAVSTLLPGCEKIFVETDTLYVQFHDVKISFIRHDYPLIDSLIDASSLSLASLPDIAAMKVSAIQQRSQQKDYIDLYVLSEKYTVSQMIAFFFQKYGHTLSDTLVRKYFTYFDDIEMTDIKLHTDTSWEAMKKKLIERAISF